MELTDCVDAEVVERLVPLVRAVFVEKRASKLEGGPFYGNLRQRVGEDIGPTDLNRGLGYLRDEGVIYFDGKEAGGSTSVEYKFQ